MDYIIFDLEWNQPYSNDISFLKRAKMPLTGEIIQIGAVKLNSDLEIVDKFSMLVKPKYLKYMHKHVSELTGITAEKLKQGVPFLAAFHHFQSWCGPHSVLLSWGSDDMLILRENMMLHGLQKRILPPWFDAQLIFAYTVHGDAKQVSVEHAMEELNLKKGNLKAHDALNDAYFTAAICQSIDFQKGLEHYEDVRKQQPNPFLFPETLTFFVYTNFDDKRKVLRDHKVRTAHCPFCQERLQLKKMERMAGDKYLSIGSCDKHKEFAVQWKVGRYQDSKKGRRYYVTKMLTHMTEDIRTYYKEKALINEEKERLYLARKEAERLAQESDSHASSGDPLK